jgi:hypothetical protein
MTMIEMRERLTQFLLVTQLFFYCAMGRQGVMVMTVVLVLIQHKGSFPWPPTKRWICNNLPSV